MHSLFNSPPIAVKSIFSESDNSPEIAYTQKKKKIKIFIFFAKAHEEKS